MTTVFDIIAAACLMVGALLCLAAGIGVLRFPDVLSRIHTAAKPQVLGLMLVLIAIALRLRSWADLPTLLLVLLFQMSTIPVAAHMVGRTAYRAGIIRTDLLITDELPDERAR